MAAVNEETLNEPIVLPLVLIVRNRLGDAIRAITVDMRLLPGAWRRLQARPGSASLHHGRDDDRSDRGGCVKTVSGWWRPLLLLVLGVVVVLLVAGRVDRSRGHGGATTTTDYFAATTACPRLRER